MMADFFQWQLDFTLFFTGLAFIFFGFTFFLIYQIEKKEPAWKYLISFGILRGIYYWLVLVQSLYFDHVFLDYFIIGLNIVSFALLFEFGRKGLKECKKHLGAWIYVPILGLFISGYFLGGMLLLDTVLHFTLSFFGCLLTGLYFWCFSSKKRMEKIYVRLIAVSFLMYGISQFIVDEDLFIHQVGFPIYIVRNLFAFFIFLFAWFQYDAYLKRDTIARGLELKKNKRQQNIITLILLLPVVYISGFFFLNFLGDWAKQELRSESSAVVAVVAEGFQSTTLVAKNMSSILSFSPELAGLFVSGQTNTESANVILDQCNYVLGNSVCYVMNTEGMVMASSNRFAVDSFLGKNYAFRPYFTQAIEKGVGEYFAIGVTSNIPGYYASHAIKDKENKVIGVVVVKINLNEIEQILSSYEHICFASPEGVIFLSGDSSLHGKTLRSLSESEKQFIRKNQQFGSSQFEPLFEVMPLKESVIRWEDKVLYVNQKGVNGEGWQVVYFHPAQKIYHYRLFGILLILLFYIFVIATLVTFQMIKRSAIFAYFASVIYTSQDAVIGKNLNGEIQTWNAGAEQMYGYSRDEIRGKTIDVLLPETERLKNKRIWVRTLRGENVENLEMKHVNKKGELFDVSVTVSPIKDVDGIMIGVSYVVRDVSRAKQLEKMRTEFISIASHQLRTPLTGIKWFSELLLNGRVGVLKKEQKEYIQQIADSNQRMIDLVNDLLEVSHIDEVGKFTMQKKPENFSLLLKEIVDQIHVSTKPNEIQIHLDEGCKKKIMLTVDAMKIQQVLQNLLNNAIKFSHPNGVVQLTCKKEKTQLIYAIQDHGVGIPAHQQARVFEKFFRADNAVDAGAGTGLGLYIAKSIVEAHGGKIWFESEEGKGTTFYFSLPLS